MEVLKLALERFNGKTYRATRVRREKEEQFFESLKSRRKRRSQ